jgi:hypothetical protein
VQRGQCDSNSRRAKESHHPAENDRSNDAKQFRNSGHNHKCVVSQHRCGANQHRRCGNNRLRALNHSHGQLRHLGPSRSRSNSNGSKSRRSLIGPRKVNQLRAAVKVKAKVSRNRF